MRSQVGGIVEWHTNSDEPRAFDFEDFNQPSAYQPDLWRAADHDPLLVGLNLGSAATPAPATPWWAVGLGLLSFLYVAHRCKRTSMA